MTVRAQVYIDLNYEISELDVRWMQSLLSIRLFSSFLPLS